MLRKLKGINYRPKMFIIDTKNYFPKNKERENEQIKEKMAIQIRVFSNNIQRHSNNDIIKSFKNFQLNRYNKTK